jgi:hypothetical protein
VSGLSVLAFQRLWNRNNPKDRLAEDGAYGPQTEARLARAPSAGFAIGACTAGAAPQSMTVAASEPEQPWTPFELESIAGEHHDFAETEGFAIDAH